ncbi:triphosphoribosyl-dephospho-CoA synthase [Lactobacillus sp. DCY120]|uniref:Probable 2-(5''-triphosphoribosyl)-3'-dephosphocoenzyme-A synthase n=1 Tax=Bombilactobacillus apium TaxID=2675299 RepID=A0A850QZV6_9LACO|nr:triphosphoribosyl-dephospho-CoA synthase [Bombilactobacillus apium]NVY96223.1 triphosphoribosyl-dephospho-CoA synthase [Bombilactobacillus apium]
MLAAQNQIVTDALRALLYEVSVQPKPGLVDPVSHGSHPDMDVFTFIDSSLSLAPYLRQCVQAGSEFQGPDLTVLFQQIRPLGIEAEKTMLQATGGVNTHKGAIFALGISVCAQGYRLQHPEPDFVEVVCQMLSQLLEIDFAPQQLQGKLTAGQRQYQAYGFTGIRGEAAAGFPIVIEKALPRLERSSGTLNQRLLDTLMEIVGQIQDSNLIKRAHGPQVLTQVQQQVQQYFALGGSQTVAGSQYLQKLDQQFTAQHWSLGGSADLLIVTIFLAAQKGILERTAVQG